MTERPQDRTARGTLWMATTAGMLAVALGVACGKSDKLTGPAGQLATIVVSPSTDTIVVGNSQTFTATGKDASGRTVSGLTFFWSSSSTANATVTQSGQATAVASGTVKIAASVSGISGLASVVVAPKPVGSIVIVPSNATLRIATTLQLRDTVKDASGAVLTGATITWSSDSAPIAAVDGNGLVTARALGTAHITAASGGKQAQATITVSRVPVASITVTPSAPTVFIAQTTQLTAVTKDSAGNVLPGRVVRWSSGAPAIATIDSVAGLLTGVSAGSAIIRAKSEGVTDSVTATVTPAPANTVVLSPSVSQVDVGANVTLTATVTNSLGVPIANPTVTFSSNQTNIASVTGSSGATGQILAGPNAGTATITGTSGPATGTATIIVSLTGVDSVHITAARDTLTPTQTETLIATAYDSSGNPLTGRAVTWQSTNSGVATINGGGGVTAVAPGVAVVFATISGVKGSLALFVNPAPVGSVTIAPHADTIAVLGQVQLHVTVRDVNGTVIGNAPQNWYTTNGNAIVSGTGLVAGLAAGTVSIIDSVGGKADTNTTLVVPSVASVVVYPTPDTIFATSPNNTIQLRDSTYDAGGNNDPGRPVSWSITSGSTATVAPATGLVTGKSSASAAGPVTVTATNSDKPSSGSATVLVLGHGTSSTANVALTTLSVSGTSTTTATASILDSFGNPVEPGRAVVWTTSDPATVTLNGSNSAATVTTTAGATVTIGINTATTNTGTATVSVAPVDNPSAVSTPVSITVNP